MGLKSSKHKPAAAAKETNGKAKQKENGNVEFKGMKKLEEEEKVSVGDLF